MLPESLLRAHCRYVVASSAEFRGEVVDQAADVVTTDDNLHWTSCVIAYDATRQPGSRERREWREVACAFLTRPARAKIGGAVADQSLIPEMQTRGNYGRSVDSIFEANQSL